MHLQEERTEGQVQPDPETPNATTATVRAVPSTPAREKTVSRPDLTGHTIIIELLDAATAREINRPDAANQLAIVECHDDRRGKICAVHLDIPPGVGIEAAARGIARTYGARYAGMVTR
ncbi:hypothetical protein ACGF0J_22145 [Nonomuraea sp. NPDC047897]|uniref:hypothetical protein n=1 Tax=Nonomuraea sp. NPDC047897 TaxID=3364346 RepID=UPI0037231051